MKKIMTYLILAIAVILALFPFYFMFVSATNLNADILSFPPKLSVGGYLTKNMGLLLAKINIWRVMFNSLFVSTVYTLLTLVLYSAAGYALAKYEFKGKRWLFGFVMVTMMLPQQVLYIPLFKLMAKVHLTNTYASVILPLLANAFGIFLMRQNMLAFPTALIEASRIDGYGEFGIFFRVVLPNMKPALGALGIYMFTSIWNNFMWPLIILGNKRMYTFPVALAVLDGNPNKKDFAVIMLATSLATLPILFIFMVFQRYFIAGVMGGAVKE